MSFTSIVDMNLMAASLASSRAPVPKTAPATYTIESHPIDEPLPALGDNKAGVDEKAYDYITTGSKDPDRKIYLIRDKDKNVVGAFVNSSDRYVTYALGSGVNVALTNEKILVSGAKGDEGITLDKVKLKALQVLGPNKGNAELDLSGKTDGADIVRINKLRGNMTLAYGENTKGTKLEIQTSDTPSNITIKSPQAMLAGSTVNDVTPVSVDANGIMAGSAQGDFTFGMDNRVEINPLFLAQAAVNTLKLSALDISIETTTPKGKGTIELYKEGVPQKDKDGFQKTFDALKAKAPVKEKGMDRE